jgi:hypothetical protein
MGNDFVVDKLPPNIGWEHLYGRVHSEVAVREYKRPDVHIILALVAGPTNSGIQLFGDSDRRESELSRSGHRTTTYSAGVERAR